MLIVYISLYVIIYYSQISMVLVTSELGRKVLVQFILTSLELKIIPFYHQFFFFNPH